MELSEEQIHANQSKIFGISTYGASLSKIADDAVLSRVKEWIEGPKPILTISSSPGKGKTYFCAAIYAELINKVRTLRAFDEGALLSKIRASISESSGDYRESLHYFLDDEIVIIDDVGSGKVTDWRIEILFEIVNLFYKTHRKILLTTNLMPSQFKEIYGERSFSRLASNENIWISFEDMPDYRQEKVYEGHAGS